MQVLASFPAPMLFPLVIVGLASVAGHHADWGSIVLMLLGTQWYILFNVIAGAMAVPADLKEAARSYNITGWQRFKVLYFPALFPVPGHRLGDGGGRRLERQHRGRVRRGQPGQRVQAQAWGPDIMKAATANRSRGSAARSPKVRSEKNAARRTTRCWLPASS